VRVAHAEEAAGDLDGVEHRRADADALVVDVAARREEWDAVHKGV